MSDPMNTPPPEEPPRKGPSPLIWILILIALIAFGWYFYNQRTMPDGTTEELTPPPATSDAMTPAESSSAENEPDTGKAAGRPKTAAKATTPRSREVALIEQPQLEYPLEAARAREEGTVLIEAQVDALGNVSDVGIAKRSGSRTLDRAAMREVRRWKFRPAMEDGKAVASSIQVPVDYRLEEESQ